MNVSGPTVATYGSAAIASPPAGDATSVKRDDQVAPAPAQQAVEAPKSEKTSQLVDVKV